jgi:hypothetical protein
MKLFLVSVRALILALVSVVVFGCASSQPTRYVKIAGSGTNQVLVPVQSQKAPSRWKIWNSGGVKGEYVLAPGDKVPDRYMPPNPVKNRSGSFTLGSRIQSSYARGTDNSSIHYWDQHGPHTVVRQTTYDNGYNYVDPNPLFNVYRDHHDFQAAPAQPLQPIR